MQVSTLTDLGNPWTVSVMVLGRNKIGDLKGVGENLCWPVHDLDDKMEVKKYIFGMLVDS